MMEEEEEWMILTWKQEHSLHVNWNNIMVNVISVGVDKNCEKTEILGDPKVDDDNLDPSLKASLD